MINAELLNQAGINYEAGINRFMDDADLYEAVLTAFLSEDILERAAAAYEVKDCERLLKIVHEAKGSVGNAGLDELYSKASKLLSLLRSPSFTEEELALDYTAFSAAFTAARVGIKAALGE